MRTVRAYVGRNLRLFYRDPLGVFFSLTGALVVFLLYALFLGQMQVDSLAATPGFDGDAARDFVDSWMFAGVVAVAAVTTPLGALSTFVEDAATGRFRDFLVSPVHRAQLVLGYLGSAFVIGLITTLIVLAVALGYLAATGGTLPDTGQIARIVLWTVLSVAAYTALWAFVVSFLRTSGSYSGLSTLVGTLTGFVAGAYIPVGSFPDAVRDAVGVLPFAQSAMLVRREFAAGPLDRLAGDAPGAVDELARVYGLDLQVGTATVPVGVAVVMLIAVAVVFTVLASARIRSRIR
ncbi:ABC transporter permease [Microbacterium sp. cf332]|uniref:ABC transporter permease n=1 Tax=Microbacterium sp. cf332 TaxID=1761804 RepID=UPI000884C093|nr:ABC transporter permease [Microbacterium sp. cf332]SDQ25045.1 multidrug/hemolysin transport system permease protein [Microbacterium sp. cf332]